LEDSGPCCWYGSRYYNYEAHDSIVHFSYDRVSGKITEECLEEAPAESSEKEGQLLFEPFSIDSQQDA
jgi:hypothetical protein